MLHFRTVSPFRYVRLSKFLHSSRMGTASFSLRTTRNRVAEGDRHAGTHRARHLGDRVLLGALATPAHDEQVAVTEVERDALAPCVGCEPRPEQEPPGLAHADDRDE